MAGKKNVTNKSTSIKKKKKAKSKEVKTDDITLETITSLGGSKADLQLIGDLKDDDDEILEGFEKDWDVEPVKHDEIRELINTLELHKYRNLSVIADEPEHNDDEEEKRKDNSTSVQPLTRDESPVKDQSPGKVPTSSQSPTKEESPPKKKKGKKNKFKIQDDEISSTSDVSARERSMSTGKKIDWSVHISSYKARKHLLLKPGQRWYDEDRTDNIGQTADSVVQQMEQFASKLLADEVTLYNKQRENSKRSDTKWLKTVLSSGTLSDKMAALTLLVGESPIHNLSSLDSLVNLAKKKGKREAMAAVDALKDLFLSDILPSERKLKYFHQHSLLGLERLASGNKDTIDKTLMLWSYEAELKEKYGAFIKAVDMLSYDTLAAPKQKAISVMYQLLANKPEGEKVLLPMLVNKLGDPDYKVAAKASHLLTKLVSQHPNMNSVVVSAVEVILYRPNISKRAQYYAVCFLNQIVLDPEDEELAAQLVKIYFSFFRAFVQQGEVDSKMMSALLTGVNRAYPFTKGEKDYLNEQLDHLYKIVHMVNFNTSLQALMLLHHVTDSSESVSDRFYMALYKKLADPALKTSSKQAMFLNLVFKTLKHDTSEKRIKAFFKRLLQVCGFHSPAFVCGVLFMLSEVLKKKPEVINFTQTFEDSDDEEHFVDLPEEDEAPAEGSTETNVHSQQVEKKKAKSSWVHRRNKQDKLSLGTYDPFHRNPQFCGADKACTWELRKLTKHFHPSVALFAQNLLQKTSIVYTSDPLQDFTLIKFLDRFVYKNPKKRELVAKSVMSAKQSVPRNMVPVTSDSFIARDETMIPEDEKYLYKYFSQKSVRDKEKGKGDSDAESISDDEFDAYLDQFESGADQGEDFDFGMDFAGEFGKKKAEKKGKKGKEEEEESDEEEDVDDMSDVEMDFDSDDDLAAEFKKEMKEALGGDDDGEGSDFDDEVDLDGDGKDDDDFDDEGDLDDDIGFNEEDIEFSDEDELVEKSGKKRRAEDDFDFVDPKKKKKDKFKKDTGSLFAAAEEFSHLLDDNTGISLDMLGGTNAMANKDNSSMKQMKWETDREKWVRGESWKNKRGQKRGKGGGFKQKGGNFKPKGGNFKQKGGKKGGSFKQKGGGFKGKGGKKGGK